MNDDVIEDLEINNGMVFNKDRNKPYVYFYQDNEDESIACVGMPDSDDIPLNLEDCRNIRKWFDAIIDDAEKHGE